MKIISLVFILGVVLEGLAIDHDTLIDMLPEICDKIRENPEDQSPNAIIFTLVCDVFFPLNLQPLATETSSLTVPQESPEIVRVLREQSVAPRTSIRQFQDQDEIDSTIQSNTARFFQLIAARPDLLSEEIVSQFRNFEPPRPSRPSRCSKCLSGCQCNSSQRPDQGSNKCRFCPPRPPKPTPRSSPGRSPDLGGILQNLGIFPEGPTPKTPLTQPNPISDISGRQYKFV